MLMFFSGAAFATGTLMMLFLGHSEATASLYAMAGAMAAWACYFKLKER